MIARFTTVARDDVANGFATGLGLQILMLPLAFVLLIVAGALSGGMLLLAGGVVPLYFWGIFQLVYIGPLIVSAWRRGHERHLIGLCMAGILTCVLHAAFVAWTATVPPWE